MTALELSVHVVGWLGLGCWVACFIWMHRISTRQDRVLRELHALAKRIERFSKVEHDLIQEIHPQVSEIKDSVEEVTEAMVEK